MAADDRAAGFRALHERDQLFVMPNPWDRGSAKLLASLGFEALATTSAGLAWSLGKLDQQVTRDELVAHVAVVSAATPLPLNVDSERCYPDEPGGISQTVSMLADAGAAGFSIEDYDPGTERIDDVSLAAARVVEAVEAARAVTEPLVVTARCENHIRGVDDFDDTCARLVAYRDLGQIAALVEAVGVPVNVLALRGVPTVDELESVGVRRVSTGGGLAARAYGALIDAAQELRVEGSTSYAGGAALDEAFRAAFGGQPSD
jgi:2-methylisocitrate lyase-like PEP mutase family enzyme